jgi:inner membrane transporter RhtA
MSLRGGPHPENPSRLDTVPAPVFFVAGAVSQYIGAALAVALFQRASPVLVAWLRVVSSGALLWLWRRPRWTTWPPAQRWRVAAFGVALASMNLCFYLAADRLPLGNAVAIEFTGPIAVAAVGIRNGRNLSALGLAVAGVVLLADVGGRSSGFGVVMALAAAALWAAYIVLGRRVAEAVKSLDGLTWSSLIGAAAIAPLGLASAGRSEVSAGVLAGCVLVGILSSVIPYGLDQVVLRRLSAGQFALLLALLPATAALVGAVALRQVPRPVEAVGIGSVIVAVMVSQRA